MRKTEPKSEPVTFIDTVYRTRTITVDGTVLEVKHGQVTVRELAQIEVLDKIFGMKREKK